MQVPAEWPTGRFDLIVFSEVLYFLAAADIARCADRIRANLLPGAVIALVNWLGETDDPTTGDEAAERFIAATAGILTVARQEHHRGYRLDVLISS